DVAYFDVTDFSVGDTFVVTSTTSDSNSVFSANFEQVIGIAFDTGIIAPPGETFATWISGFTGLGGLTGLDDDADGDGIDNGVENYFGTFPNEFSQGLVSGTLTGNTFTFAHPLNASPATNLTATYRWSKDLSTFNADGDAFEGTTVDFVQGTPAGGMVSVTATITGAPLDRLFVDIEVTQD
ncbi:hypothetical protein, partial [Haloferula sp. A504]|uniref:hypothetical protein n=1 Tax=Haloferula sp. A504 TaxID=3373601 RepID=UPI0031C0DD19|nr:hypothetical protein [Verrucomicrobiaceae bacterium E54]